MPNRQDLLGAKRPWLPSVAPPAGIYANAPGVAAPGANIFGAVNQSQAPFPGLAAGNPNAQLSQLLLQATQERYVAFY